MNMIIDTLVIMHFIIPPFYIAAPFIVSFAFGFCFGVVHNEKKDEEETRAARANSLTATIIIVIITIICAAGFMATTLLVLAFVGFMVCAWLSGWHAGHFRFGRFAIAALPVAGITIPYTIWFYANH